LKKAKVTIDKLVILGDEVKHSFEQTINNNNFGFIEGSGMAKHPYDRNFYMTDGSVLQHSKVANMKALRYEFNPNNINTNDKENTHLRAVYECINTMKYPKISRIDVAIDLYDFNLSEYNIIHESVKTCEWKDRGGRIETYYIGAPNSDIRFRIYNKAKEQKIDDLNWWRVEVQLRDELAKFILSGGNPFELINFVKPAIRNVKDMSTRAMLFYLEHNPTEWENLSKPTKIKYKKILNTLPSDKEINLADLYNDSADKIKADLKKWLYIAEKNNVIQ
jgi:hypothetical protein